MALSQLEYLGNDVAVTVDTIYPFSDSLTTTIVAQKAFTYYVRIPSWASNATISVNGGRAQSVSANGLHAISVRAGTTKFTLNVPAEITLGKTVPRCQLSHVAVLTSRHRESPT